MTKRRGPLLTFFTRACRRPEALERNIQTVLAQSSRDWEQLFLVDRTGRHDIDPIVWANTQFARYAKHVRGRYVYPLDDDGYLIEPSFVARLGLLAGGKQPPDVVLVKTRDFNFDHVWRVHPQPDIWDLDWEHGARPSRWVGNGFCVVVRTDVWRANLTHYQHAPGGDWHFITALINAGCTFKRLDLAISDSPGRGCGVMFEKCGPDWFMPFVERYKLTPVAPDAWRLTP